MCKMAWWLRYCVIPHNYVRYCAPGGTYIMEYERCSQLTCPTALMNRGGLKSPIGLFVQLTVPSVCNWGRVCCISILSHPKFLSKHIIHSDNCMMCKCHYVNVFTSIWNRNCKNVMPLFKKYFSIMLIFTYCVQLYVIICQFLI